MQTQALYGSPPQGPQTIPTFSSHTGSDPNVVAWATRAFFKFGGRPTLQISSTSVSPGLSVAEDFGYGVANNAPKVIFSHSHDGFCLYMSRLLRLVWNELIAKSTIEKKPGTWQETTIFACRFTKEQLLELQDSLGSLRDFLAKSIHSI